DAKVAATRAIVNSQAAIGLRVAADWDKTRFPAAPDLIVLQTATAPSPDGWVRLNIDNRVPSAEGPATPEDAQTNTLHMEPMLFVDGFRCRQACDADAYNSARLTSFGVALDNLVRATTVRDITNRAQEAIVTRPA